MVHAIMKGVSIAEVAVKWNPIIEEFIGNVFVILDATQS
jgi:hypothetical protein